MIARKISLVFGTSLFSQLTALISFFFIARYMGPTALGIVAFAFAYINLFNNFADLGFGSAHIKRISEGKDLGKCVGTFFTIKFVLLVLVSSLILIFIHFDNGLFDDSQQKSVVYLTLGAFLLGNASMPIKSTFGGLKEIAKQQIPNIVNAVILCVLKISVAILGLGVIALATTTVVSRIFMLLVLLFFLRGYPISRPNFEYLKSYARFAIPIMFVGILAGMAQNIDKVMIGYFYDVDQVAYYAAGQKLPLIFRFFATSVTGVLLPYFSGMYISKNMDSLVSITEKSVRYISLFSLPFIILIFTYSDLIIVLLFGNAFLDSGIFLKFLILNSYFVLLSSVLSVHLPASENLKSAVRISAIVLITNIFLNTLFIPAYFLGMETFGFGAIGAVYSTLISIFMGLIAYYFVVTKKVRIGFFTKIYPHLISGLLMYMLLFQINIHYSINDIFSLITVIIISISIYFSLLVMIFRDFGMEDFRFLLDMSNPSRMNLYIKEELSK